MTFMIVTEVRNTIMTEGRGGAWLLEHLRQGPGHFAALRIYKVYKGVHKRKPFSAT